MLASSAPDAGMNVVGRQRRPCASSASSVMPPWLHHGRRPPSNPPTPRTRPCATPCTSRGTSGIGVAAASGMRPARPSRAAVSGGFGPLCEIRSDIGEVVVHAVALREEVEAHGVVEAARRDHAGDRAFSGADTSATCRWRHLHAGLPLPERGDQRAPRRDRARPAHPARACLDHPQRARNAAAGRDASPASK